MRVPIPPLYANLHSRIEAQHFCDQADKRLDFSCSDLLKVYRISNGIQPPNMTRCIGSCQVILFPFSLFLHLNRAATWIGVMIDKVSRGHIIEREEKARILFMGSGDIACQTLERLLAGSDEVVAVVTQPDRPQGRKLKVAPCAVKAFAESREVQILSPERVGAEGSVQDIRDRTPDLIVVAAYGQYIKPAILAVPRLGSINLHPSLLPKYRGAAPIQMAIANGEQNTGVTILYVSEDMDAGDIILQREVAIDPDDTVETMTPKLAKMGADMIMEAIDLVRQGRAPRVPQDDSHATYVKKLTKEDGRIDWSLPANTIRNRIRGFTPWPGCYCQVSADSAASLKILWADVEDGEGVPGTILSCNADGPLVAAGERALRLRHVQPAGKKCMTGAEYLRGTSIHPGDRLG